MEACTGTPSLAALILVQAAFEAPPPAVSTCGKHICLSSPTDKGKLSILMPSLRLQFLSRHTARLACGVPAPKPKPGLLRPSQMQGPAMPDHVAGKRGPPFLLPAAAPASEGWRPTDAGACRPGPQCRQCPPACLAGSVHCPLQGTSSGFRAHKVEMQGAQGLKTLRQAPQVGAGHS